MYDRHSFLTKPLLEQMLFATSSVTNTGRCQNSQTSTLSKAKAVRLIGEGIFFCFLPFGQLSRIQYSHFFTFIFYHSPSNMNVVLRHYYVHKKTQYYFNAKSVSEYSACSLLRPCMQNQLTFVQDLQASHSNGLATSLAPTCWFG